VEGEFALIKDNMSRCDDTTRWQDQGNDSCDSHGDSLGKCMFSCTEFVGGN
jgi:hypothetical protein